MAGGGPDRNPGKGGREPDLTPKASDIREGEPLHGINVFVTGGSRDIGAGIVRELSSFGAKIASVYARPMSAVRAGYLPADFVRADLAQSSGREDVYKLWDREFGGVPDVLVLNASGKDRRVDTEANPALVEEFLKRRRLKKESGEDIKPATVVLMQSEPGHFYSMVDGVVEMVDAYSEVGPAKEDSERSVRSRIEEMDELGVKFITVCPPWVPTLNTKYFERMDPQAKAKSESLSGMLGTRPSVEIEEVAQRVRELIQDPETPHGHFELFGDARDAITYFSEIYGPSAIYVHTLEDVGTDEAVGRVIVNPDVWKRGDKPSFNGSWIYDENGEPIGTSLEIQPEHARDHFKEGLSTILPGHESLHIAGLHLGQIIQGREQSNGTTVSGYESVKFKTPVRPGTVVDIKSDNVELDGKDKVRGDVFISHGGVVTAEVKGMNVTQADSQDESVLELDQLVEMGAQTAGLKVLLESGDPMSILPQFLSTGKAEMLQGIRSGDNLIVKAHITKRIGRDSVSGFRADVKIYRRVLLVDGIGNEVEAEEQVAYVDNISAMIFPRDEALARLGKAD